MARNVSISICKGIAIIAMVVCHAECPGEIINFFSLFHMPLFFIASGYFFSKKYLDNPWTFVGKRFTGLYVPMVKWSVFFLLIHNLLFAAGILNEQYGNWSGGVTHPYTWHQAAQRLVNIFTAMGGYDEFMAGAFWFFRALLISSIVFLVLYRLLNTKFSKYSDYLPLVIIVVLVLGFAAFKIGNNLKVVTVVQGGIRETWGVLFIAVGVLYRCFESYVPRNWWVTLLIFLFLMLGAHLHFAGMNLRPKMLDVLTLPITGVVGFIMVHNVALWLSKKDSVITKVLSICGDMSIYIYVFHIASYKVVSVIKIMWYGLDWHQIGCHMVIHDHHEDYFWVLYAIAGVALPLLWMHYVWPLFVKLFNGRKNA